MDFSSLVVTIRSENLCIYTLTDSLEESEKTLANPATSRKNKGQGRNREENGRCYFSVTQYGDLQPKQKRYGPQFPHGDRVPEIHPQCREDTGISFRAFSPGLLGSYF